MSQLKLRQVKDLPSAIQQMSREVQTQIGI